MSYSISNFNLYDTVPVKKSNKHSIIKFLSRFILIIDWYKIAVKQPLFKKQLTEDGKEGAQGCMGNYVPT